MEDFIYLPPGAPPTPQFFTDPPTYAPTLSPVAASIQVRVMIVFLVLIFAIIGCSCCMSKGKKMSDIVS